MSSSTFTTWATTLVDLCDDVTQAVEQVQELLNEGGPTKNATQRLRASIAGHQEDIRTFFEELDTTDTEAEAPVDVGEAIIRLWKFEQDIRHSLGQLQTQLVQMSDKAFRIEVGIQQDVYVAKSGDTWQDISNKFYKDHRYWSFILEANNLEVGDLVEGLSLIIPELKNGR